MRLTPARIVIAASACTLLAASEACVKRPLPAADDGTGATGGTIDSGTAGQGGDTGASCSTGNPRLELIGAPLLVLDSPSGPTSLYPSLLWTGDEYLFTWRVIGGDGLFMQRIDTAGQAAGGNVRVRDAENALDLAWGGGRLAAAWTRPSAGANVDLMFQTFDRFGRPLIDAVTLRASPLIATDGSVLYGPRIVPIADGFAIVWNEDEVLVATVDPDGHLRQGPIAAGGGDIVSAPHLSLAAAPDRVLVGWNGARTASPPLPPPGEVTTVTRAFSGALVPLDDGVVLDSAAFSGALQVLATGSGFLALWTHSLPIGAATGTTADVDIAQLDGAGVLVADGKMAPPVTGPYRDLAPAAWNGDHLVVLWDDSSIGQGHLTLSRFAPDGLRQGAAIDLPTMSPAGGLYVTAHDRTVGFIWSEKIGGANEVYFQQARACP